MRVDPPRENIPSELVKSHYKFLKKMHMSYEKMQIQQEFSYMKYAGVFLAASLAAAVLANKGVFPNYLVGIVFIGFGVLVYSIMRMLCSFNMEVELARSTSEGREVEEKYDSLIKSHYFQIANFMKVSRYRLIAALRLVPFIFVGVSTIFAGIALSMKISTNIAALVGFISAAVLGLAIVFLLRLMRKRLLLSKRGE